MNGTANGITDVINAIRGLTGVGICYYDLNSFFQYDKYGVQNNRGHYCEFCKQAHLLKGGRESCDQSDKIEAVELARQYKKPFFHECHMGMRELVIPLMRDDALLGILFVGQCRTESENKATIQENAKNMNGNPEKFLRLYQELPLVTKKDILLIETILLQYFETKILSNELLRPESLGGVDSRTLAETVYYYIKQNYRYTLSTKHLSDTFFVNPSYLSRRFSQCYGITITDFIAKVRVEHAKRLLITTNASIGSISLNVGYDNANYFTRVFKKNVGFSPTDYRTNHRC